MEREGTASHLRITTSRCNTEFYSVKGTAVLRCPIRHRKQVPPGLLTVADAMPHLPHGKNPLAVGVKSYQLPDAARARYLVVVPERLVSLLKKEPPKPVKMRQPEPKQAPHAGVAAG